MYNLNNVRSQLNDLNNKFKLTEFNGKIVDEGNIIYSQIKRIE